MFAGAFVSHTPAYAHRGCKGKDVVDCECGQVLCHVFWNSVFLLIWHHLSVKKIAQQCQQQNWQPELIKNRKKDVGFRWLGSGMTLCPFCKAGRYSYGVLCVHVLNVACDWLSEVTWARGRMWRDSRVMFNFFMIVVVADTHGSSQGDAESLSGPESEATTQQKVFGRILYLPKQVQEQRSLVVWCTFPPTHKSPLSRVYEYSNTLWNIFSNLGGEMQEKLAIKPRLRSNGRWWPDLGTHFFF